MRGDGEGRQVDEFSVWLEGLVADGGMPSADVALEMAVQSLDEAGKAARSGDEWLRRYYVLASGQALGISLAVRASERLIRIEQACPGLEDEP